MALNLNSKGYTTDDKSGAIDPVESLQALLNGESTSFNSFENCLQSQAAVSLHELSGMCRDLHAVNIALIKQHLTDLNVEPKQTFDFWQSLAGLLSSTAPLLGEDALLTAFRKNELALLEDYENRVVNFGGDDLVLVQQKLIPNQIRVCELLGARRSGEPVDAAPAGLPLDLGLA